MFLHRIIKPKELENFGVIQDPRPKIERQMDYKAEEIIEFAPPRWEKKTFKDVLRLPIFDQDASSSCLAQATAKTLGMENLIEEKKFVKISARDIYTRRINSGPGMSLQDVLNIGKKWGGCLEELMPSQRLPEDKMNDSSDRTPLTISVARLLRASNYLFLPLDLEAIASQILSVSTGKPVIIVVRFGSREWSRTVPKILYKTPPKWYYHGVCARDAFIYKEKKGLLIDDSWGPDSGYEGMRFVNQDWFEQGRILGAGYFLPLPNPQPGIDKPKYKFKRDLYYGLRKDKDVQMLQKCLNYLGMFPFIVDTTGNFFGITLAGVQMFQRTYSKEISDIVGYQIRATGYVGLGTRGLLNKMFS